MSDLYLLIACSIINVLLITALVKADKKYFFYSLIVFAIYTAYFYYGLFYQGQYGSSLVWLIYLLFINAIHSMISIAMVAWLFIKKKKS